MDVKGPFTVTLKMDGPFKIEANPVTIGPPVGEAGKR